MAKDGMHGDEITLRCIANFFFVEIIIVSALGNSVRVSILSENSHPIGRILLGHFAEGQGDHYVCSYQVSNEDIDQPDGDKMGETDRNEKDEADGYDMDEDDRDKMDKTNGEAMSEAKGYDTEKDDGDKMDEDEGHKIDEADGDKIYEAERDNKGEGDGGKTSKPNSPQNTIHGLEMLPLKILEKYLLCP